MATNQSGQGILQGAQALSEWFAKLDGFVIGCGEASALVVAHIINGTPINTAQLQALLNTAQSKGQLSGLAQTAAQVQWDMQQYGVQSNIVYSPGAKLQSILDTALAQGKPVEIGVSNANATLTGETSTNVHGHFIDIVGKNAQGYVVADPNTQQAVNGGFVQDTLNQLLGANPFAAIIPTGAGPGGGIGAIGAKTASISAGNNPACGPEPQASDYRLGPFDPQYISGKIDWEACQISPALDNPTNPQPITPQGIAGSVAGGVATTVLSGVQAMLQAPFASVGITSFADFLWRVLFIIVALVILIIAIKGIANG